MRILYKLQYFWERLFDHSSNEYNGLEGYSYYAFISYTEKDEKWAEWLQWNLEHYKIPTKVRSEKKDLPERIRPVFWYKNDLAGAHLSGAIKKELMQSKYMIVVCSPASANKAWVNDEVRYFKENLQRDNRIIPFVVGGVIKADNPDQECLPLPIRCLPREKELRCIDVREYGKSKALVNIVSSLFNVRFDVLWDRYRREQRKRCTIYGTIITLLTIVLLGCWDYFLHTKYRYYVDMVDCNGIPTGIIQIDNSDAKNHYRLYRFEYRKRMLQRVVYVDCDGNPQNHVNTELADRPCVQELSYKKSGLSYIDCKDATLKTLYIMHFSTDKLGVDLKDENENQAANFLSSTTSVDQGASILQQSHFLDRIMKSPSKISRYIYERDEDGYIVKKMYCRYNGDNDDVGLDANGISGFKYERDSLHRIIRIYFLDSHGENKTNNMGVAGKRYKYDEYGNLSVAEYIDKTGNLKYNEHHWAKSVNSYDVNGYCIEERLYGANGEPCISAYGYHMIKVSTKKNYETVSFFDVNNHPTFSLPLGESPGGFSMMTNIRNEKGQIVEVQYMDSNGNLCYNQQHVAICKIDYNHMGLVADIRNYGIDRQPCSNFIGYFHEHIKYNQKGRMTECSFFGINERPTQNNFGIHRLLMKYDNTNCRMTEAHSYNSDNLPIPCILFNNATWVKLCYRGSSKWVSDIMFFGVNNNPLETSVGAKVSCDRDPSGQIIAYRYYNNDYELTSNINHCAIMELEYNNMGMEIERRFYDHNKVPTLQNGVFCVRKLYTATGQLEKICLYDTLRHLRVGGDGWAVQKFKYVNGVVSANSCYGENEEPIEIKGVHKYVYEIDDCGYVLSQSAYDQDLRPTINTEISAHKVVNIYDSYRRIVGRDYFDSVHLSPFVRVRVKYNQRGLQIEQTAYNSRMELVESPLNYGVAKIQSKCDSQDRTTYMCATDPKGNRMNSIHGFAEAYFSYDDNVQEAVFLDEQMKLTNNRSMQEPCAYTILFVSDTGQRLYSKTIKLSFDGEMQTVCDAYCYDIQEEHIQKAIRHEEETVKVYDASNNKMISYCSLDDEYEGYIHLVDSIGRRVESKYGKPKLFNYVKQLSKK